MDRMEWLAEKATEIGWDRLSFILCKNSERKVIKTERIEKIVVSAMKQSHKAHKPVVEELVTFKQFISKPWGKKKYIAHCLSESGTLPFLYDILEAEGDATVLIGPEGDFSAEEVAMAEQAGFQSISLGESRLRTETAALVATYQMNLAKRK
jgi:16S rRNA (uracil1498-N3)-methyltransferase